MNFQFKKMVLTKFRRPLLAFEGLLFEVVATGAPTTNAVPFPKAIACIKIKAGIKKHNLKN